MGFLMPKAPSIPAPPPPPPPPSQSNAEVQDAALSARRRKALASGRSANILTGGQGVLSTDTTSSSTLLGG
jgi:hypothetical protein